MKARHDTVSVGRLFFIVNRSVHKNTMLDQGIQKASHKNILAADEQRRQNFVLIVPAPSLAIRFLIFHAAVCI